MSELKHISVSPHIHSQNSTAQVMADVAIALVPAGVFGVWNFGWRAGLVIAVCVAACVLTEWLYELLMKRPVTIGDFSAVVTGLLLAYNLPVSIPIWIAVLGSVFAILVVKQLFGGLGQNFVNPALAARCFLLVSFGEAMGKNFPAGVDGVTGATPLAAAKAGESVDILSMFLGTHAGCIGEVSVVAILIGAAYMLIRRVIKLRIPLVYIGSFLLTVICITLLQGQALTWETLAIQLCGGGLLLGAFFMATDYVTSPITVGGQWIYAVLLGVLTALFRLIGSNPEGVSYAILFGNIVVPLIEKVTVPIPFGLKKEGKA